MFSKGVLRRSVLWSRDEMETSESEDSDYNAQNERISSLSETSEDTSKPANHEFSSETTEDDQGKGRHAPWCTPTSICFVPNEGENVFCTFAGRANPSLLNDFIRQNTNQRVLLHMAPAEFVSGDQVTSVNGIGFFAVGTLAWGLPESASSEPQIISQNDLPSAIGAGELHHGRTQSVASESASEHDVFTLPDLSPDTIKWREENPTPEVKIVPEDTDIEDEPIIVKGPRSRNPFDTDNDSEEEAYNRAGTDVNWREIMERLPPHITGYRPRVHIDQE
ncbi:uncharacterized protein SPPG_08035 [Spizellomyces punctatus DAOM BR117]|uniref:Uncharacterized protein n=1 Tax=Spizellomyces punctatus (strain DAOM BR117) TaxID=645134 RepID=A0A0L0H5E4_SPIPD|nr:uncharacterized protein SPPG_08035 [Spizellomyces punctatus DAOM BR117]KNC96442.1 hypothetical protein SPPG_08035 [Spizellomyces punctatus DAOM BR117]|eukprot:XP_016604482.1 hypothetical protein SPPG_08035 [Spizellomyces punctatus DAOM BR117]